MRVHRGWDENEELANRNEGGGDLRRLEDHDDFATGVLLGEPFGRELHWLQAAGQWVECGGDGCQHCAEGISRSLKFWVNMFTLAIGNGEKVSEKPNKIEVFETSKRGFKNIVTAKKKYGLSKAALEIKRSGGKGDTETTYNVFYDTAVSELPEETQEAIKSAELVDLEDLAKRLGKKKDDDEFARGSSQKTASGNKSADKPIDDKSTGDILGLLKPLGKEGASEILGKFNVKRVSDLKMSQVEAVIEAARAAAGSDDEDEDDPFA